MVLDKGGWYVASQEVHEGALTLLGSHTDGGHYENEIYVERAAAEQLASTLTEATGVNWYATPRGWHLEAGGPGAE